MIVASDDLGGRGDDKAEGPSATEKDDGPKLISLQDKHDADRLLQQAFAAGELDAEELKPPRKVYAAVTPRELWKASGHRAGSPERADKAQLRKSVRLQVAIVVFAVIIMVFVLLGTVISNQGGTGGRGDRNVFPWEWAGRRRRPPLDFDSDAIKIASL